MPKNAQLLAPEHWAFAVDRYLAADLPPREIVVELKSKFGVTVPVAALRQKLTRSGVGKRKAALDARVCSTVSSARVNTLARIKAAEPAKQIEKWTVRTALIADKSLSFAEAAEKPRELASAVSALSQSVKLYRIMAGLDGPCSSGPAATFRFDFSSLPMPRVSVTPGTTHPVVQISSVAVPDTVQLAARGAFEITDDSEQDDSDV